MRDYESIEEVIEAFQSSTFSDPKLTFGGALEILTNEFNVSQDDASLVLAPEMVGAELLELWQTPDEEE